MLKSSYQPEMSPYTELYDILVAKDHKLRRFNHLVDFSFIYEELEDKYCLVDGRNATNSIMMFKYLILKAIDPASDVDVLERSKTDLAYKYFLGLNPEDEVIDPSLLSKFRRQRLKDDQLMDLLLEKSIQIANEKGVLKGKTMIVDATHTVSRFNKKSTVDTLRWIRCVCGQKICVKRCTDSTLRLNKPSLLKTDKTTMLRKKRMPTNLIQVVEDHPEWLILPEVQATRNYLEEFAQDCLEFEAYSTDESARVGHKAADTEFFGYKTHLAMTEDRLISAAVVTSGEKGDGPLLKALIERSEANGVPVEGIIGDTAYSGKENLKLTAEKKMKLFSRLNPIISNGTRKLEDTWEFNKDAGMVICPNGQMAVRKARTGKKNQHTNQSLTFYMNIHRCQACPLREGCYKEGAKSKTYSITIKSEEHQKQKAFQESQEFKERYRSRYMIEGKNSELKNRHGYDVSWSNNLTDMMLQGAVTLFTVNIKRIMKLEDEKEQKRP